MLSFCSGDPGPESLHSCICDTSEGLYSNPLLKGEVMFLKDVILSKTR